VRAEVREKWKAARRRCGLQRDDRERCRGRRWHKRAMRVRRRQFLHQTHREYQPHGAATGAAAATVFRHGLPPTLHQIKAQLGRPCQSFCGEA
jgi:hypothetical protein